MNTFLIYNRVFENVKKNHLANDIFRLQQKEVKSLIITLKSSHESV